MKVVITGINGFTGRYLARELFERGYEVHGLANAAVSEDVYGAYRIYCCDILDFPAVSSVMASIRPQQVVNLAAITHVDHKNIEAMYNVNILGTRNLLEALLPFSNFVENIILVGSANVYGNAAPNSGVLTEDQPLSPINDYSVSKIAMENLRGVFGDRLPITIVRPFNYSGVGQDLSFIVPKVVDHFRKKKENIELGNINVVRDFSDVRSVATIYAEILKRSDISGQTFNICSGLGYSLSDIIRIGQDITGHKLKIIVNPNFIRANEVKSLIGSKRKLDAFFPNLPSISFDETVRWMLEV
jgi:nucleoside-diphosphate-sugar epimerase